MARNNDLWACGPWRQAGLVETMVMARAPPAAAARAAERSSTRGRYQGRGVPEVPDYATLFAHDAFGTAEITVVITSHNYAGLIIEALDSVHRQTLRVLDLIVVDDASTDGSPDLVLQWAGEHYQRFNRLLILAPPENVGLGGARNIGVSASDSPWCRSLDADNRLQPGACEKQLAVADPLTAYVYTTLRQFGAARDLMGETPTHPMTLRSANSIDAMALVAKWAWSAAGGYYVRRDAMGWEDYDLWCSFAELGLTGVHLPDPVAEYRIHGD